MAVGRRNYTEDEIEAARCVLIELSTILNEYWDGIVLVGGWVPFFCIPQDVAPHEGTKDVDLALNPGKLQDTGYATIGEILMRSLYQAEPEKPFRYTRAVQIRERHMRVVIDFLTGENGGRGRNGMVQEIQDVLASTMHGCDVAFLNPLSMEFSARHPDGGHDTAIVQVASIPAFLIMKSFALNNRGGDSGRKDACDIYYAIRNFPGGLQKLTAHFQPYISNSLFQEGLSIIDKKFASTEHIGPKYVAEMETDTDARAFLIRDAYEHVHGLLTALGIR